MHCKRFHLALAGLCLVAACSQDGEPLTPTIDPNLSRDPIPNSLTKIVRQLAAAHGMTALRHAPAVRPALVRLGQALAFDKILSGNHDISCMTCHLPTFATGDRRSLSIGQGAGGLGPNRIHPTGAFIPRNAPPLFNLSTLTSLFWDGRVSVDGQGQFHTPAGTDITPAMARVFAFGPASAVGMFPVLSRSEMRAESDNELAAYPDTDRQGIWKALMERLGRIPEYRSLFEIAYPGIRFREMTFAHAANAIGGFLASQFAFNDSPWDQFLRGDDRALTREQLAGAPLFLTLPCAQCHNGPALTDNKFHNVLVPQLGPGEGNGVTGTDDFGHENVSGLDEDEYGFRTTPLRNVMLTGPYGHDGAFPVLRDFIDHYSEAGTKLLSFTGAKLEPLLQNSLCAEMADILETRDTLLTGLVMPAATIDRLTEFLTALTDPAVRYLDRTTPRRVPSGLPVDRP